MPEGWQIGIFIHIVAVFVLGGATAVALVTSTMMRAADTVQEVRFWGRPGQLLSQYQVFPATALVLLVSGGYLVNELDEEWGDGWIAFSAIALIAAVLIGLVVITPRMKAIGMAAGQAPDGPVTGDLARLLHDPIVLGAMHGNAMVAVAIIWNMTVDPGTVGALLSLLILVGLGWATAYPAYQRQRSTA